MCKWLRGNKKGLKLESVWITYVRKLTGTICKGKMSINYFTMFFMHFFQF